MTSWRAGGASLRALEPEVMTAGDLGRLVVTVLGMVADMEPRFIRDRRRASGARGPDPKIKGLRKGDNIIYFRQKGSSYAPMPSSERRVIRVNLLTSCSAGRVADHVAAPDFWL